ncbi:oxidoreductase, NAD-binding domain protein [Leptospira noguchii str. 1993005606]|uniref:Oxidoreductase, NAD-binding domain protein n=1 Tax=Leptospira noguchii TaxID=28182 RepID=M6VKS2_9LEPT|nr:Gfo/Idh/MocA family oxidoreductase [Leptospira noguchii]EMO53689.1 oxidoreductase, NAD-binding domain protein [Leptospira noguchii]EPE84877.1 oxidoreductase, NAD-binding domain protein [Leptospira noguchii str. 1993005606]
MITVAIVGFGYWGPNLLRNFNLVPNCQVKYVCDVEIEKLNIIKKQYPSVITTNRFEDILKDYTIDAVVIATPVFTHFELARKVLIHGKNVLIEKPMTSTSGEALELQRLAHEKNKLLMVDHTFLYTGSVQKMKQIIASDQGIGNIKYFDSTRINLGLFQSDINVLWDLAPHDISILNYLIDEVPFSVNATGVSHTNNNIENIAYLTVNYKSGFIAHFNCSWTSPVKMRTILIGGDKKMIVFNDLDPTEKIKIYDTGYNYRTNREGRKEGQDKLRFLVDYRVGDIYVPKIDSKEALFGMAFDFINSINENKRPVSDFESGLKVIKILEASQQSIKQSGREIILN